jgi:superfamily II DNA or RNA helicase
MVMTDALQPHAALLADTFQSSDPWDILSTFAAIDTPRAHAILLYYIMKLTSGIRLYNDYETSTHDMYDIMLRSDFSNAKAFRPATPLNAETYVLMEQGFTSLQLIAAFKPVVVVNLVRETIDRFGSDSSAMSISERVTVFLRYNVPKPVPSAESLTKIPLVVMYADVTLPATASTLPYINMLFEANTRNVLPLTIFRELIDGEDSLTKLQRALSTVEYAEPHYIEVLIETTPDATSAAATLECILSVDLSTTHCNETVLSPRVAASFAASASAPMEEVKETATDMSASSSHKRVSTSTCVSSSSTKRQKMVSSTTSTNNRIVRVRLVLSRALQRTFFEDFDYVLEEPQTVSAHIGNSFYRTLETSGAFGSPYVTQPLPTADMLPLLMQPFPDLSAVRPDDTTRRVIVERADGSRQHVNSHKHLYENATLLYNADKKQITSNLVQPKHMFADACSQPNIERTPFNGGLVWRPAAAPLTKVTLYGIKPTSNKLFSTSQVDALDHINRSAQIPVMHHVGRRVYLPNGNFQLFADVTSTLMTSMLTDDSPELQAALQVRTAILALETGMGKTLTSLAAIAQEHLRLKHIHDNPEFLMRVLIVVPDTLLSHWTSEITKHTEWPSNNIVSMRWSKQVDKHSFEADVVLDEADADLPIVYVMSPTSLRSKKVPFHLPTSFFHMMVVDEVQTFNMNTNALQKLEAWNTSIDFKLFTTATPSTRFSNISRLSGLQAATELHFPNVSYPILLGRAGCLIGKPPILANQLEIVRKPIFLEPTMFVRECHRLLYNMHNNVRLMQDGRAVRTIIRNLERVSAGGQVNEELILQVIKRLINRTSGPRNARMHQRQIILLKIDPAAFKAAPRLFTAKADGCVVCLCAFENPLELSCGHVICTLCFESLISLSTTHIKCPHCRAAIEIASNGNVYTANARWMLPLPALIAEPAVQMSSSSSISSDADVDHLIDNQHAMRRMLTGDVCNSNAATTDVTNLKSHKLVDILVEDFMPARVDHQSAKLVIFVHRDVPAAHYRSLLQSSPYNLTVTTAGVFKTDRKTSVANIQAFRSGMFDVLMLNFRYATGFDFCNASHLVLMDFDTRATSLVQASGRVTRIGQIHNKVVIYTIMLRGCLDAFVYTNSGNGDINMFSKESVKFLQLASQLEDDQSPARKMIRATEILIGSELQIADQKYFNTIREMDLHLVSLQKKAKVYTVIPDTDAEAATVQAQILECTLRKRSLQASTSKITIRGSTLVIGRVHIMWHPQDGTHVRNVALRGRVNVAVQQVLDVPLAQYVDHGTLAELRRHWLRS